ncbi:SLATT domain-containing protein [Pseudomonas protegens]|uniref:SLATT domain-containing protein n=1 Tax=Pseudomonas TaxID=286 RepID=UPI00118732E9
MRNYWLGILSVALSSVAGTAFMKEYGQVAAGLSAVITVLTTLMTFLKPSERASAHKNTGDQYFALRN